jgi:hypothetical protein
MKIAKPAEGQASLALRESAQADFVPLLQQL